MVPIVIIAHRPLAGALVEAARHVYSRFSPAAAREMRALDVDPDCDTAKVLARAREIIREADRGAGVLVLVDLLGATPGNIARQLADPGRVEVISGASMPMVLRSVCYSEEPLEKLAARALDGGVKGIEPVRPDAPPAAPVAPCGPAEP